MGRTLVHERNSRLFGELYVGGVPAEQVSPCLLIAGLPRGGTTMVCELLNQLPDVCALDEPMDVISMIRAAGTLPDAESVHGEIERFAIDQRRSILERGVALTKHVDGRVIGAKVSDRRDSDGYGQRVRLAKIGEIPVTPPSVHDFTLAIKHPVAFTALLPILLERFEVFAIVRNPLAVLASWESVPMAVRDGRLGLPSSIAPLIAARLDAIDDRLERQLALLQWFYESFAQALPRRSVIRYEDLILSGGTALQPISPSAIGLDVALESRNAAPVYEREHMGKAGMMLLERGGPYTHFYSEQEVRDTMLLAGVGD
jgi:hypothetical protein